MTNMAKIPILNREYIFKRVPFFIAMLVYQRGKFRTSFDTNQKIHRWVFPKIVVPQNGLFIMESPIKMGDLGGTTIFGNIQIEPHPFQNL